jgi:hypothetical protein
MQVLSSRLMPVSRDAALVQNAKTFCSDFLASGGLGVLVNILQKDGLPSDVDSSTRQDCYAICLMLLRCVHIDLDFVMCVTLTLKHV